ncbi:WGR domain-containing protein [Manganibacter manganicus]|uniref:WGR domain-containing protein n=1 Tax=Manganibacter manganicus TaxID=1873176 RepID=A0A1V8RQ32_9HYPH|nr:WGR domain-containing protein [Pseudaminobacter manganicus]OQM75310.1 WGR domain-containing protein [Pseudaminobacter manganicus]
MSERILYRIDPSRNMARFYVLDKQPTLFGEISLVRGWGRIGTNGRIKIETFGTGEGADRAFCRLEARKRRRGYRDPC